MKKLLFTVAVSLFAIIGTGTNALAQDTVELTAALSGANEVGESGDPDGTGTATITLDATGGEVCYDITTSGLDTVTAGHIHSGGAGSNGGVVVDFALAAATAEGCVAADAATITSILNAPSLFYVNVHTEAFPDGAIRGQLAGAAAPAATPTAEPAAEPTAEAAEAPADDAAESTEDDAEAAAPAPASSEGEELAFTGDMTGALAIFGAALVVAGGGALVAARRRR